MSFEDELKKLQDFTQSTTKTYQAATEHLHVAISLRNGRHATFAEREDLNAIITVLEKWLNEAPMTPRG